MVITDYLLRLADLNDLFDFNDLLDILDLVSSISSAVTLGSGLIYKSSSICYLRLRRNFLLISFSFSSDSSVRLILLKSENYSAIADNSAWLL